MPIIPASALQMERQEDGYESKMSLMFIVDSMLTKVHRVSLPQQEKSLKTVVKLTL